MRLIGFMPRRRRKKSSLLSPAGNFIRKLSESDTRLRRRVVKGFLWTTTILFAVSILFGTYSIPRIVRLHLKKNALIESNRNLSAELIDASRLKTLLISDRNYIEQIARSRYYMVYPNETIYRYRGH